MEAHAKFLSSNDSSNESLQILIHELLFLSSLLPHYLEQEKVVNATEFPELNYSIMSGAVHVPPRFEGS